MIPGGYRKGRGEGGVTLKASRAAPAVWRFPPRPLELLRFAGCITEELPPLLLGEGEPNHLCPLRYEVRGPQLRLPAFRGAGIGSGPSAKAACFLSLGRPESPASTGLAVRLGPPEWPEGRPYLVTTTPFTAARTSPRASGALVRRVSSLLGWGRGVPTSLQARGLPGDALLGTRMNPLVVEPKVVGGGGGGRWRLEACPKPLTTCVTRVRGATQPFPGLAGIFCK